MAKNKTAPSGGTKTAAPRAPAARTANVAPAAAEGIAAVAKREDEALAAATAPPPPELRTSEGGRGQGPKSALEGGRGSVEEAEAGNKAIRYGVQVHSDEAVGGLKKGVQVIYVEAKSGDEAALKVREAHKANYGLSIRGVTPASDPDPNSMGGERDAAIMIANAHNDGAIINTLGTEANAKATAGLAKADIEDLGE